MAILTTKPKLVAYVTGSVGQRWKTIRAWLLEHRPRVLASFRPPISKRDLKELEASLKDAMKDLKVTFRIEAPFRVLESNATRKDGNSLFWEYNVESLETMQKDGKKDVGVRVRYEK